jgi:hypothetical protein
MAWWMYLGKVTTPVSGGVSATLDERGPKPVIVEREGSAPTVLVPRLKFEAPMSTVSHLTRLKKVVALKPHQTPKRPEPTPEKVEKTEVTAAQPAPVVVTKSEEKPKEDPSDGKAPVVASDALEGEPEALQRSDGHDAGEEKSKAQQEKQSKGGKRGSKKRRG